MMGGIRILFGAACYLYQFTQITTIAQVKVVWLTLLGVRNFGSGIRNKHTRAYPNAPEIKIKLEVAENCVIIYTPHHIRIIRIIKSRTMKYAVHILRMRQKKHVNYKRFSFGKHQGKRRLGRIRHGGEGHMKYRMGLRGRNSSEVRGKGWSFVNIVTNMRVIQIL